MSVLIFEDWLASDLYPITISRPAYTISCGSYRLIDLVEQLGRPIRWLVRPHLAESQAEDFGRLTQPSLRDNELVLLANAALVPSMSMLARLRELLQAG